MEVGPICPASTAIPLAADAIPHFSASNTAVKVTAYQAQQCSGRRHYCDNLSAKETYDDTRRSAGNHAMRRISISRQGNELSRTPIDRHPTLPSTGTTEAALIEEKSPTAEAAVPYRLLRQSDDKLQTPP